MNYAIVFFQVNSAIVSQKKEWCQPEIKKRGQPKAIYTNDSDKRYKNELCQLNL